jgi:hypothetical protein
MRSLRNPDRSIEEVIPQQDDRAPGPLCGLVDVGASWRPAEPSDHPR